MALFRWGWVITGWGIGCAADPGGGSPLKTEGGGTEDSAAPPADSGTYTAPATTETPALPRAELEARLAEAAAAVLALDVGPIGAAYDRQRASGDAVCPGDYPLYDANDLYWYGSCESASGGSFSGAAYVYATETGAYDAWAYSLYATMVHPDGSRLSAAGYFAQTIERTATAEALTVSLTGSFSYDGPTQPGTWLEQGLKPEIGVYRYADVYGGRYLYVDGALSGLTDETTVAFDELNLTNGYGCLEPVGTASVRWGGDWFDATFGEDCDGCAPVSWRGTVLGEVCIDASAWLGWEGP
jgi:hypothetical protein